MQVKVIISFLLCLLVGSVVTAEGIKFSILLQPPPHTVANTNVKVSGPFCTEESPCLPQRLGPNEWELSVPLTVDTLFVTVGIDRDRPLPSGYELEEIVFNVPFYVEGRGVVSVKLVPSNAEFTYRAANNLQKEAEKAYELPYDDLMELYQRSGHMARQVMEIIDARNGNWIELKPTEVWVIYSFLKSAHSLAKHRFMQISSDVIRAKKLLGEAMRFNPKRVNSALGGRHHAKGIVRVLDQIEHETHRLLWEAILKIKQDNTRFSNATECKQQVPLWDGYRDLVASMDVEQEIPLALHSGVWMGSIERALAGCMYHFSHDSSNTPEAIKNKVSDQISKLKSAWDRIPALIKDIRNTDLITRIMGKNLTPSEIASVTTKLNSLRNGLKKDIVYLEQFS